MRPEGGKPKRETFRRLPTAEVVLLESCMPTALILFMPCPSMVSRWRGREESGRRGVDYTEISHSCKLALNSSAGGV